MKLYLIVAKGKRQGMPIPIQGDLFMMGSDPSCHLRSKLDGMAPQHCAIITRDEKKVFVRDLGGGTTLLNDELVPPNQEWPLHTGDRLVVGPLEFLVKFHEKQLSQRDAEEWALKSLDEDAKKKRMVYEDEHEGNVEPGVRGYASASAAASAAKILDFLSAQRGIVQGRLRVSRHGDILTLRFNDVYLVEESEISFIKHELMEHLHNIPYGSRVLLDFKNVRRMSSVGAEMIDEVRRRLRSRASSLALCRLRPDLHFALEALHIFDSVPHFNDKGSALEAKW
ncbi:MAG: hypothetical protein KatS3mg105_1908 [Gemmatales bacterium]|nr:MAG: hypothetical protein KatS3mg105_1908 [Gemmatales bacterium]